MRSNSGSSTLNTYAFSGDNDTGISSPTADVMRFATAGADRMAILPNGQIGIGTNTPAGGTILDLNGWGPGFSSILIPRDTTSNRPAGVNGMMRYNTDSNKFEMYENGMWKDIQAPPVWQLNGGDAYYVTGRVGIGTVSVSSAVRLSIEASETHAMSLMNSNSSNQASIMFRDHTGADKAMIGWSNPTAMYANTFNLFTLGTSPIVIGTGGMERMRMTPTGNIGIGTSDPDAMLDVSANMSAPAVNIVNSHFSGNALRAVGVSSTTPAADFQNTGGGPAIKVGTDGTPIRSVSIYTGIGCTWAPSATPSQGSSATCSIAPSALGNIPVNSNDHVSCSPQLASGFEMIHSCHKDGSGVKIVILNASGSGTAPTSWNVQVIRNY